MYPDFINQDIEMLDLSKRASNALLRHSIKTIGNLIENHNYIISMRCIGRTTYEEINEKFINYYKAYLKSIGKEKLIDEMEIETADE